jgi:hypothetical protein
MPQIVPQIAALCRKSCRNVPQTLPKHPFAALCSTVPHLRNSPLYTQLTHLPQRFAATPQTRAPFCSNHLPKYRLPQFAANVSPHQLRHFAITNSRYPLITTTLTRLQHFAATFFID